MLQITANMTMVWLILMIVLAVIELATLGLVTIWFAAGAAVAMLASALGAPFVVQIILFIAVSVLIMIFVRPLASKYVNARVTKTNIDAAIGKKVMVTAAIDNSKGAGKVTFEGSSWNAISTNDSKCYEEGQWVIIDRIEGTKVFVYQDEQVNII